ncbi:hypothetical protein SKAU_G00075890 [Synaphobranchus kaupii]|uniref:Uncharacterized protein n=1 Tax=Synaphobranchus kaupii TaxID=118154 RepID=A0A9Q1J9Z7_SYNKA|nr:hypothetical protein SKAU_G00075890 [Synaphobranchus kaupii]
MDARIQNLENSPPATSFVFNEPAIGASPAATYNANPASSNLAIEPRRNMGTAVPAAPVGVPFFPPAAAISSHLRAQILAEGRELEKLEREDKVVVLLSELGKTGSVG